MTTNAQLRQIIFAALDCHTHFHNPTIINNKVYTRSEWRDLVYDLNRHITKPEK